MPARRRAAAAGAPLCIVRARAAAGADTIAGGTAGGTHPWHIHEGACGSGGPVVGPANAYPPLQVAGNGAASAEAHLMLKLNEARRYPVNVHASPAEMGNVVACGDLDD